MRRRLHHCAILPSMDINVHALYLAGSMSERYAASGAGHEVLPFLSKLESLAGSAVRAAGKVQADLIVVYTATGEGTLCLQLYAATLAMVCATTAAEMP